MESLTIALNTYAIEIKKFDQVDLQLGISFG